jgi:hypothetical protein
MPRSGTSWLAHVLSQIPRFTYYREPDNYDHVAIAQRRFATLRLETTDQDHEFAHFIQKIFDGELATDFTMQPSRGKVMQHMPRPLRRLLGPPLYRHRRRPNLLVKFVHAIFTIPWIASHYPTTKSLYIYRHPCGQFLSWKRLGWRPHPAGLLQHAPLMRGFTPDDVAPLEMAESFWEKAGALWAFKNEVVRRQIQNIDNVAIVPFEWLCLDPISHFQQLFAGLNLPWGNQVEEFLRQSNQADDRRYSLRRRSSDEIEKWKKHLNEREISACRQFAECLAPHFFEDFDPMRPALLKLPKREARPNDLGKST